MHPHRYDSLRGAQQAVMEQLQTAPSGLKCRPDLSILNTHREPIVFIEIVRTNRRNNSIHVNEELNIPVFSILAPHRQSMEPELQISRPWWEFDPTMSDHEKRQMRFMDEVGKELMHRYERGDSTWAHLDMMVDEDGNLTFASFSGSSPDLSGRAFPRAGGLIVAEQYSLTCEQAMEIQSREREWDHRSGDAAVTEQLERDLGRMALEAIQNATDNTARFIIPVGSQEVHLEMSLHPLNSYPNPPDPSVLHLQSQLAGALEKVRRRYVREQAPDPSDTQRRHSGSFPVR